MKHLQIKKLNVKNLPTEWSMDSSVKEYLSKNPALKLLGWGVRVKETDTVTVVIKYLSRKSNFKLCDYNP